MSSNQYDESYRRGELENIIDGMRLTDEELDEAFGPGSFGSHALMDRLCVVREYLTEVLLHHPSVLLHEELFERASRIVRAVGGMTRAAEEYANDGGT